MQPQDISDNYQHVLERIDKTARSVGRSSEDICLVIVTKTHPIEKIEVVVEMGARNLGENYIGDAIPKIAYFAKQINLHWHMVGHVQSRKAVEVCDHFQYIHSLDSLKLAEKYSRILVERNKTMGVWLEFNVSGEESKYGWDISDETHEKIVIPEIEKVFALPNMEFLGLMTIPPYSDKPEDARPYFVKLRRIQESLKETFQLAGFYGLSMGMSNDYEIAIQEGATCVRIGQAIFGPRD